jgi:2-oxoglutarate/2-oxoacid ferredoxin oxidoreductase subunit beta
VREGNGSTASNGSGAANGSAGSNGSDGTANGSGGTANGSGGAANGRRGGLALVPRTDAKQTLKDFKTDQEVRWCPGCGDYAILAAVQSFMPELGLRRENIVFVSGIGCSSRFPYYMDTYGFHSIHGRAPAIATGLAASRPDLSVWVVTGDGDALSIGGNHLIHALRRNINLKILLFNNRIYGLTKGQYSPTSEVGKVTKSTPMGSLDAPFNPISLALGAEATFVARTLDSDRKHLQSVLRAATEHKGTALVEIYQNCNIFNDNAFEPLKDPGSRDEVTVRLEHGEPLVFGQSAPKAVVRSATGGLDVVPADSVDKSEILVHDAHADDPSQAFALSRLDSPAFGHTPVGIFRQVQRPSYDELMSSQLEGAVAEQGAGDLGALLGSGDTWRID